jgi:threonine dehydrogenase-like Zn-dependent dehydrogenase
MPKLPETMKALVAYTPDRYVLEADWPRPKAGPGEIVIRVEACGVCAGDVKAQHGAERFWNHFIIAPFIPGHEFVGHVVELGSGVTDFSIGDRVVSEQIVPCGKCMFCRTGRYWMCEIHDIYGFKDRVNGGMAEYMRLPANARTYRIPMDMPIEKAILVEPYSCSKHAVDRAQIGLEDVVVISGCGTLGLGMVGIAHLKNPKILVALDIKDERLEKAKEFGADFAWNPLKVNIVEEIRKLTEGYGCDIYIEATGHPASVVQGMDMIRKLGRFVEFSVFGQPTLLDWSIIGDQKELDILGAHLSPYCFPPVIDWIDKDLIGTRGVAEVFFTLDDWEAAFRIAETGEGNAFKVVLKP